MPAEQHPLPTAGVFHGVTEIDPESIFIAVGVFKDAKTAADLCVKVKDIVYPNKDNTEKYSVIFDEYKRIHDALAPIYKER
jgi:hypothetical protein